MLEKFKVFELNKKQQEKINGNGNSALIPNSAACARSTGLYSGGAWLASIGMWIHC